MRNLIKIVLLGCVVFFADNSFAVSPDIEADDSYAPEAVAADCTEPVLADCWDPDPYIPPRQSNSADASTWCKTWSTSGFTCSGTYMMGVYTLTGTPIQIVITTTCGAVDATVQNGTQIENILATYSQSKLDQMAAEEVRNHEGVLMVKGTFSGGGTGSVSIETHCGEFTDASAANDASSGSTKDPINTHTGELFDSYSPDLNLGGPMPLLFSRYYASGLKADGVTDEMGDNWLHNFEWTMTISGTNATITSNKGRNITFSDNGTSWDLTGKTDLLFQLVTSGSDYVLYVPGTESLYTFSTGKLTKIEDGKGNTHTLTYSGNDIAQVTDGLGRTLTFTYGSNTKLSTISDGIRTVTFGYTNNNLTSITDPLGYITQHAYDMGGLMTTKTRPEGNVPYTQTYNADETVATQTDALTNTTTLSYNSATGVTTMTDPLSNTRNHTHSSNGEITANQREDGNSTSVGYDSNGRRNSVTDLLGDTTTLTYHAASGKVASITNADNNSSSFSYTARTVSGLTLYDKTGITHADGTTESKIYDVSGNITSLTDQLGRVFAFTYNNNGQRLTSTNPLGGIITNTFNADKTLASIIDPAGNNTTFGYDSLKLPSLTTHSDGSTESFTYDNANRLLTGTDENGDTKTLTYDTNGNLKTITDPLGNTTTIAYNGNDQLISITDPLAGTVTTTYDQLGRVATFTDAVGNVTINGYDALGWLTSVTDPLGNIWATSYDLEGVLASRTNPLGNTMTFTSDNMGRTTRITSPLGNSSEITYDAMGFISTSIDPLGNVATFGRDATGLLSSIILSGNSISTAYTRNQLGQILTVTDPNGNDWNRAYDDSGRLISSTDPLGNLRVVSYDNRNRVSVVTYPGVMGTLTIGYDVAGNPTSRTYSGSTTLNYTYDANGRLINADGITNTFDANGRNINSNGIASIYDARGRTTDMTLALNKAVTYAYDGNDQLTSVTDWAGGITTFTYDAAGQLATITRPNGVTSTYTYDNDGRVTGLQEGSLSSISLVRDGKGQVTTASRSVPLGPTITTSTKTLTYNAASQVASYTYDAIGRITNDGTRTYTWDLASRLTNYTENSNTVTFTYDALGYRVSRTESGTTRDYVWNYSLGLPSISVARESSSDLRYYVHTPAGVLLYSIEASDNSRRFYHYDEMGNALFLTNDSGSVIGSYAYSPYGELLGSTGSLDNPFTWQGKFGVMQEGTSGLYYIRARYYDSGSKRFISRDPIERDKPRSVNPYQYAFGNPLLYRDVNGREGGPQIPTTEAGGVIVAGLSAVPSLSTGTGLTAGGVGLVGDAISLGIHLNEGDTDAAIDDGKMVAVDVGGIYLTATAATAEAGALTGASIAGPAVFIYAIGRLGIANWEAWSDLQDLESRIEVSQKVFKIRTRARAREQAERLAQAHEEIRLRHEQYEQGRREIEDKLKGDERISGDAALADAEKRRQALKFIASLWKR